MKTLLKRIEENLPFDLLILSLLPLLIACFVDFALVDLRYILINLIWILPFSLSSISLKNSIPNKIGAVLFFIIGFIEISHWLIVKGPLTIASILTIGATNIEESRDFFNVKASWWQLILIPYTAFLIYSLFRKRKFLSYKSKRIVILIIWLIFVVFVSDNAVHGRFFRKGTPYLVKVVHSFSEQYNLFKQTENGIPLRDGEAKNNDNINKLSVIIIGESLNRNHMSLYGYNRKTNPKLENRKDLFVFTDVVSPYSNTINSVMTILSEANLENKQWPESSIDIFDIFSTANFKTYWLSNQPPYGVWENKITTLGKKSNFPLFINLSSNSSFEATQTSSYDEKLFTPFSEILNDSFENKLIIIHLMGNHTSYRKRYPESFAEFSGSGEIEKTRAEYDNSVLYNDFIIDSIINLTNHFSTLNNITSSVIYISDHGENVYDENNEVGHTYAGKLPKSNVEIPLILWLSEDYKKNYQSKTTLIEANIDKPFVSDDLFHSIIDLNEISSPFYDSSRSIFNQNFNSNRKRILEDGKEYGV